MIQGSIANYATNTENEGNYKEELNTVRGNGSNFIRDNKLENGALRRYSDVERMEKESLTKYVLHW